MAPDVIARKLERIAYYRGRLARWATIAPAEFDDRQHEIERYLQALADIAADLLYHLVALHGEPPDTKRAAAEEAARRGIIPADLGARLVRAFGQRNLIVHDYERIDPAQVRAAIPRAIADYAELIEAVRARFLGP